MDEIALIREKVRNAEWTEKIRQCKTSSLSENQGFRHSVPSSDR